MPPSPDRGRDEIASNPARRPSVVVMPFHAVPDRLDGAGQTADDLTHDLITRLAKLRSFFVIAEGSAFALGLRGVGSEEDGRRLNVDYVASGSVRRRLRRLGVSVELIETGGRPGDDNGARPDRSERRLRMFIATSFVKVLRRPLESAQYASEQFQRLMADSGIVCSMSRSGNVWDSAAMESFFSSLKTERTERKTDRTRNGARADVFDYTSGSTTRPDVTRRLGTSALLSSSARWD